MKFITVIIVFIFFFLLRQTVLFVAICYFIAFIRSNKLNNKGVFFKNFNFFFFSIPCRFKIKKNNLVSPDITLQTFERKFVW